MPTPDSKRRRRFVILGAAVLIVAVVLIFRATRKTEADHYVLKPIDLNYTILANCTVDYPRPLDMSFQTGGIILAVEVADGDRVAHGQTLLRIDDFEARRNLAIREDSLRSAELKLKNARDEVLPSLAEKLREAEGVRDQAERTLKRFREIEAAGGISKAEAEKADREYQTALSRYNQQKLELDNYSRSGRLADLAYQVSTAKSQLELARRDLENTRLAAPFEGTVVRVDVQPGERATPALRAVTLLESASWQLVLNVDQKELPFLKPDLAAAVTMDAYPETRIDGHVSYVCSEVDKERNTCELRVEIPRDVPFIKSGMAGKAEILAAKYEKALALPARFVKRDAGRPYVWTWDGRKAERVAAAIKPVGERWVLVEGFVADTLFLDAAFDAPAARLKPGREIRADSFR
ncbi:MAG: HlyD family secretion protein [Candidatus Aminicenantes bacterium]|nr:HlyD family secretion protein [Candidatus Aminicenantes bacterium]